MSDDNHEVLVDYTLEQTSIRIFESTVDHLSINEDDMRNFLTYVSQTNVDLSVEAALLLKNYFVASRSNRIGMIIKETLITLSRRNLNIYQILFLLFKIIIFFKKINY